LYDTAVREAKEESKNVFEFGNTLQRLPHVTSQRYDDQRVYCVQVVPAHGQKVGLYVRDMFQHNDRVLRRNGAGREFFEMETFFRVLVADLRQMFATNPSNSRLHVVGTHGETGILSDRDAMYLRSVLASGLDQTAPTLHSTYVQHANGIQTYHLA
jgi:hypothetical protein